MVLPRLLRILLALHVAELFQGDSWSIPEPGAATSSQHDMMLGKMIRKSMEIMQRQEGEKTRDLELLNFVVPGDLNECNEISRRIKSWTSNFQPASKWLNSLWVSNFCLPSSPQSIHSGKFAHGWDHCMLKHWMRSCPASSLEAHSLNVSSDFTLFASET